MNDGIKQIKHYYEKIIKLEEDLKCKKYELYSIVECRHTLIFYNFNNNTKFTTKEEAITHAQKEIDCITAALDYIRDLTVRKYYVDVDVL